MFFLICIMLLLLTLINIFKVKKITISTIFCIEFTFLAITNVILKLPKNLKAYIFIFLSVLLFSIPNIIFTKVKKNDDKKENRQKYSKKIEEKEQFFKKINKFVIFFNIIGLVILFRYYNFSVKTFTNISLLMKKMNSISSARYSDNVESLPFVNRIINSIVYACCAYNGFFMSKRITKINCVNIVLILVQTIITNTKATLIFGLAFLFAGYFVGMQYFDIKINIKKIIHIVIAIIFFLIFSVVINYLRHAGTLSLFEEFKKILVSYFIGPFSAFSAWFSKSNFKSLDLGANTFSCIFRLLGIQSQAHGEFVIINNEATNVYTIFKHLINDYSVLGTLIISNLLGLISFICDSKVINKKYNFIGMSIIIDATILLSFFSSIFRYTTNILASILILIFALPVKYGGLKNEK